MTPGRLWWLIQRDLKRGFAASWHDRFVGPKIWRWRNPNASRPLEEVPLVVVLGREHLAMTAWMLASWTEATGRNWRILLHDDGTLPVDTAARFRAQGFEVNVTSRQAADERMLGALASQPRCHEYRARYPLGLKIFDVPTLHSASRFLLFDPDVLFFRFPDEILRWVDQTREESCWFNEDAAEASNVSAIQARELLGLELWPRVNSGVCLLCREAISLDFCERVLTETSALAGHFWRVEQTLFALCASRTQCGGLLPPAYEVSLGACMRSDAISRHYVGAVRNRFWSEGVRRLKRKLLRR